MTQITKQGREIAYKILDHIECDGQHEIWVQVKETVSLIVRHSKSLRRYEEIMCGNDTHSGEWVNANYQALETKYDRLKKRITSLVDSLPVSFHGKIHAQIGGDPRGYVVKILIPTGKQTTEGETLFDEIGID